MNLAAVFIRRPVFAVMLIAAMMVFGAISYPKVGIDSFPEVEFPVVTTTIVYPGADPETMATKIAEPVEEAINTMGGINTLRSINLEGVTQVIVEFELGVSADQAVQDIRDRVSRLQSTLPAAAEAPIIEKFDIGATPIMTLAVASDIPPRDLTRLADKVVKDRIQRVPGVGGIDLIGGREREIQVLVDPARLAGMGVTVDDVTNAIRAQNLDMPAGNFESAGRELSVKTKGEVKSAAEVGAILLPSSRAGVRVRDVAEVRDGMEEARSTSFLDGKPAVSLVVRKQSGSNTVAVAKGIRAALVELEPQMKKAGAVVTIPTDNSTYIEHSISEVQFDLVFGAFLAIVVIFFFLVDFRATLISALAIPTSVVATFAFIQVMGFTFNNMTMLGLSLAIGILIDDAIVVMENIHRHLEQGKTPFQAAADATSEIFLAVLAMTSTIIAVFLPVAVMKGIVGRFFLQFGLTVSFAVAISMVVSFTLTPMLSSRLLRASHGKKNFMLRAVDWLMGGLERGYGAIIRWALRWRIVTLVIAFFALAGSGVLVSRVPAEFVPAEDQATFTVTVELPSGSTLAATTEVTEALAKDLRDRAPGVVDTLTTIGGGAQAQVNKGTIQVNMVKSKQRTFSQQALMNWTRERFAKVEGVKITLGEASGAGGSEQPIQLNIRGDDLAELARAAEALKAELLQIKGLVDVDTTYRGGKPEVAFEVDRERAADLGVPASAIATTTRALMAGDAVSELKDGGDAYDITVRLPPAARAEVEGLANLQVRSQTGQLIDLASLVKVRRGSGPTQIDRQARQTQVTVLASLDGLALGEASPLVDAAVKRVVPAHLTTDYAGTAKIMEESFGYMIEALLLAVILVYMILAAQFDSFIQPITIMVSLPLSFIGAFGALYITGMSLSIFSMIGIIMLMGLVTKNAILLVDFANQLRRQGPGMEGKGMKEALEMAGTLRLRPILMTTIAMIAGMMPVAMALGEGGEQRAPMAVCVIGGLVTSTLLTLIIVPVVYTLFEALTHNRLVRWIEGKVFGAGGGALPAEAHQGAE
jgi:HAE1 family hydrophobic/amphiphilic exporter-1